MTEWIVRIAFTVFLIGMLVWTWRSMKDINQSQQELEEFVIKFLKDEESRGD